MPERKLVWVRNKKVSYTKYDVYDADTNEEVGWLANEVPNAKTNSIIILVRLFNVGDGSFVWIVKNRDEQTARMLLEAIYKSNMGYYQLSVYRKKNDINGLLEVLRNAERNRMESY